VKPVPGNPPVLRPRVGWPDPRRIGTLSATNGRMSMAIRPVAAYICPENFKQGGLANVLLRLRRSVHQSAQSLAARLQPGGTSSPSEPSGGEPGAQGHPVGTQASVHARRRTGRFLPRLSPGFFPFCMRTGPLPSSAEKNRLDLLLFNGSVPDPDPVSP